MHVRSSLVFSPRIAVLAARLVAATSESTRRPRLPNNMTGFEFDELSVALRY